MNRDLEEKIKEASINVMNLRLKQCLLSLIYDLCEHITDEKNYKEPVEAAKIKLEFFALARELSSVVEKPLDERDSYLEKLLKLKDDLTEISKPVIFYDGCINQTGTLISNKYKANHIAGIGVNNFDYHQILHDCADYLGSLEDSIEKMYKKSILISCFPHLMPRAVFSDYIKRSFSFFYEESPSPLITQINEILKARLAPFKQVDISAQFPLISDKINEIWNMDLTDKTNDELEELFSVLDDTQSELDQIGSDYNMLYNDLNFLYALGKYSVDKQQLFEDDFELKDLYYSACELTDSVNAEAFGDTIYEAAEKRIENIFDEIEKEEKILSKYLSGITDEQYNSMDEATVLFINLAMEITELYSQELVMQVNAINSVLDEAEPACENEINAAAEDMTSFIQTLSDYYTPSKLKLAKQLFTENIPCPYSDDELLEYIHNTLDSISGKESLIIALDRVGNFFEEEGFFKFDENDELCGCGHEHHHEHHHHDGCGCGHHHH